MSQNGDSYDTCQNQVRGWVIVIAPSAALAVYYLRLVDPISASPSKHISRRHHLSARLSYFSIFQGLGRILLRCSSRQSRPKLGHKIDLGVLESIKPVVVCVIFFLGPEKGFIFLISNIVFSVSTDFSAKKFVGARNLQSFAGFFRV